MATNYNPAEIENSKSLFNEAGFVIKRLHEIQSRINSIRVNISAWNIEQNCYNYEVLFADLCSLLNEVWAKLTDEEQKKMTDIKKMIEDSLDVFPPHETILDEEQNRTKTVIVKQNLRLAYNLMDIFEKKIKVSLDAHGLSNPDVEGDLF